MAQVKTATRYVVELPSDLGEAVDALARDIRVSRNRAAAAFIRMGLKYQKERHQRIQDVTRKIRQAANDDEAAKYDQELAALIFGVDR
jgi:metal-responsive CopG/Arc/MetJ family transcriptional regulator